MTGGLVDPLLKGACAETARTLAEYNWDLAHDWLLPKGRQLGLHWL